MIAISYDNIFNVKSQAFVNPVNCVGIMGKGLALEFKLKYPEMFQWYKEQCNEKKLYIGKMLTWQNKNNNYPQYIINFPTKIHWQNPSYLKYIEIGMKALKNEMKKLNIHTISIPAIGCGEGRLNFDDVFDIITNEFAIPLHDERYNKCKIRIYVFPPKEKGAFKKNNY